MEHPTRTLAKGLGGEAETAAERLGPYVDALTSGGVGSRRAAADGLRRSVRPGDGPWLLQALATVPDVARFAVANALGDVGGVEALEPLFGLLEDPFARQEAAEAVSRIALRTGQEERVRERLAEPGLGNPWRWAARARLGDEGWLEGLLQAWPTLAEAPRIQALEAALELPRSLRERLRDLLKAEVTRRGGHLRALWERLA